MSSADWRLTLANACDAILPADGSAWRASVPQRAIDLLDSQPDLARSRLELAFALGLLESPLASMALTGSARPFSSLDRAARAQYLRALSRHPVGAVRGVFQALKRLAGVVYYGDVDHDGRNPTWTRVGYPGPLEPSPAVPRALEPTPIREDTRLDCDVVVVGSGVGGGMVAAELAQRGHDVIVLERGEYLTEADFTQRELQMLGRAYMAGGFSATTDQGVVLLAGACLGGGSVVNYTTSFRTPDGIREEWSRTSGLDLFTSREFDAALDAASARLSVNVDHNRPSKRDELMQRGLTALGWHCDRMPRNVIGCTQDDVCGYCGLGCVRGAKRSSVKACLESASRDDHARIVTGCMAERVLIERGRAVGVAARDASSGARLHVRARTTVVAGGSIGSPALLLRSGVEGAVGHHLRLHPVTAVWGRFGEEVRPWTGTIQALYSDQFANLDGNYGARFETAGVHPSFLALGAPWHDAEGYDRLVSGLARTSVIGVLLRDRSAGQVRVARDGSPRVRYRLNRYDQQHVRTTVAAAAQVLDAAGAQEVFTSQSDLVSWLPQREPLSDWMRRVDGLGYATNQTLYFSFHQMGSCRVGANRRDSVVNADGQVHDVRDLFVADASLFPSASGVNPMLTIAALAYHVAGRIHAAL